MMILVNFGTKSLTYSIAANYLAVDCLALGFPLLSVQLYNYASSNGSVSSTRQLVTEMLNLG
jgi:hypothetical protein